MENEIMLLARNLQLGEGCIWDDKRNKVHFVDIEGYKIYSYSLEDGSIEEFYIKDYVGCIVLDYEGRIIAAVRDKILSINLETKDVEMILQINQPEYLRFNDGKCDRHGNLWVGTMAIDQSHSKAVGSGKLYCISNDHIIAEYNGFTIPNGLAWNAEGDKFYHIDTKTQKIDVYDVMENGIITNKRTVVSVQEEDGAPDGMCIDSDENLWVAMWGMGKINCYNSSSGEKLREIQIESKNVSCCSFGGKELDTLFITTAKEGDHEKGCLYKVKIPGVYGREGYRYG